MIPTKAQLLQILQNTIHSQRNFPVTAIEEFVSDAEAAAIEVFRAHGLEHARFNPPVALNDKPQDSDDKPQVIPESFPYAKALLAGGVGTFLELAARSDEELLAIEGIGPAALNKIRTAAPAQ